MDNVTNKAIIIAVGIFVTITITSGILFIINEMRNIYSDVYKTDISINSRFSEFDAYDETEKTGLEVTNTFCKYKNDPKVIVQLSTNPPGYTGVGDLGDWLTNKDDRLEDGFYSLIYKSSLVINDDSVTIIFTKI